jgi:hypothetical protein
MLAGQRFSVDDAQKYDALKFNWNFLTFGYQIRRVDGFLVLQYVLFLQFLAILMSLDSHIYPRHRKWVQPKLSRAFLTYPVTVKLFDIKYKGERIIYEIGLQEAIAN